MRVVLLTALAAILLLAFCAAAFAAEATTNSPKTYTLRVAVLSVKGLLPDNVAKASGPARPFPQVSDTTAFWAAIKQYWPDLEFEPVLAGALNLREGESVAAEFGGAKPGENLLTLQGELLPEHPAEKPNRSARIKTYFVSDTDAMSHSRSGGGGSNVASTLAPVWLTFMGASGPNQKPEDYTGHIIVSVLQEGSIALPQEGKTSASLPSK